MKILYVLGFLPPYVSREIEAIAQKGHTVSVLLPENKKNSQTADFWSNISKDPQGNSITISRSLKFEYLTCSVSKLISPFLCSLRHIRTLIMSLKESEFRYFLISSKAIRDMDLKEKPEIIHAHFAHDQAHIARIMGSILKIPYSVTTHATDIFVPKSKTRLERILIDSSIVFTISNYNLSYLNKHYNHSGNIVVVKLGLDLNKLPTWKSASIPPLLVCTASGLVSKKGVPFLLQAQRLLMDRNVNCRLRVIGSDPNGTILQKFRNENSDINTDFVGLLTSEETMEVVSKASIFVLPCIEADNGDKDGIPVALMEAMGLGLPCVSTEVSGIPELIENGVSGILVQPKSPEELADAIQSLLAHKEMAARLGKEGKKKMLTCHSPENLANIMISNFEQIIINKTNNQSGQNERNSK